jgi:hypothetical protein
VLGLAVGLVVLSVAVGCDKTSSGSGAPASTTSPASKRPADPAEPVPGIETTQRESIGPNAALCVPTPTGGGRPTPAAVADPAAPRITVGVPDGWSSAAGSGDTALAMTGPAGMSATVTIAPTNVGPQQAFLRYTAGMGGTMTRQKFSVTGGQFCGYSSQLLTLTVQGPHGSVDFADRVTHVWTNTKSYLVAIHLEAPAGASGFKAAKSVLMQQFAVVIP